MKPYYEDQSVQIWHGDCRTLLPSLPKCDLVLTDPPYGISHSSSHGATWQNTSIEGDETTEIRDWLITVMDGVPMIIFGVWKAPRPKNINAMLIWDKGPASGMGDLRMPWKPSWEEIYVIGKGFTGSRDEGVIKGFTEVTWQNGAAMNGRNGKLHPHHKPLSLCVYLLSKCPEGVVLDPFMGSGTTLRAAKDLGRKAIGIEIEEKYCEIAARRMQQECLPLTVEPPKHFQTEMLTPGLESVL